jgi:preprotein translocase subunit SecY
MAAVAEKETVGATRWLVTIGAAAIYFVGDHIPLPGVDAPTLGAEAGSRLSLFALGVMPIISGLVVLEIARLTIPPFARWAVKGPSQAQTYERVARGVALGFAALQALGIAAALERASFAVDGGGWPFRLEIVAALVGATAVLVWLSDAINAMGVGDGLILLYAAPLAAHFPAQVGGWWKFGAFLPAYVPTLLLALTVLSVAALIAVSRRGSTSGPLDLWPLLLAGLIFQAFGGLIMWPWNALVAFVNHLFGGDLAPGLITTLEMGGVLFRVLVAAGLFAVVALRRARVDQTGLEATAGLLLIVEFVVWSGSWLIAELTPAMAAYSLGFRIILCVAAALSLLPTWRGGRALAPG